MLVGASGPVRRLSATQCVPALANALTPRCSLIAVEAQGEHLKGDEAAPTPGVLWAGWLRKQGEARICSCHSYRTSRLAVQPHKHRTCAVYITQIAEQQAGGNLCTQCSGAKQWGSGKTWMGSGWVYNITTLCWVRCGYRFSCCSRLSYRYTVCCTHIVVVQQLLCGSSIVCGPVWLIVVFSCKHCCQHLHSTAITVF